MQPKVKIYTVDEARQKLENYCIYQDRCYKEVREKLYGMRMIPEAIEQITIHLIEEKYLNEERFARSFARGKFKTKKWGKIRIIRELRSREISKRNIDLALQEINEEDYLATFEALVEKRMSQLTSERNKYKKRKKLADYMQYRGWPMHWIYEKTKELIP
ncbi:MAG TPA: RecX family transcriptional regulator [Leeuwenhoekiella sp.]|nr:RecX family transcriptional regulator [Leeuwenhoekiella sp.]